MLRELRLKNVAVIEEAALEFDEGFTVLTGETGAGKSLLVGALNLVLGARASTDLIRTGADEASVEAAFEDGDAPGIAALLEEAGIEVESTLIVKRTLSAQGKNRVFVNGSLAPLNLLTRIGRELLNILGQHEHHTLLHAETQRELLDAFAAHDALLENDDQRDLLDSYAAHRELLCEMQEKFDAWQVEKQALDSLQTDEEERARRIDYLRYLSEELGDAALQEGEEESLNTERARLAGAEKIVQAAGTGYGALYESEDAIIDRVNALSADLAAVAKLDENLAEAARLLGEAAPLLEEAAGSLQHAAAGFAEDSDELESRLNEIESRLDLFAKLRRKHGAESVDELIATYAKISEELESLEDYDSALEKRRRAEKKAREAAEQVAKKLHASRVEAANRLGAEVCRELEDLNMNAAQLIAAVSEEERLSPHGSDEVAFLFAPNLGETPRPLAKIASGGELSRVLLALRLILTEPGRVRTLVLDEVDAGIGGITAEVVGRKIRRLSKNFQVICITHLPQIACQAQRHLHVSKAATKGRTQTRVDVLGEDERVEEISRMLGGSAVTKEVRTTARQLLRQSEAPAR
ncbi:MAG: DNA repair protein RecN [Chrysiogenetes bacterium]|nr:DNA repair protein RecN [Chrysiogenetes bacterium]